MSEMVPMSREEIKGFFELADEIEVALGALPHRDALNPLRALQEMRDIVGEQLPGGYFGVCLGCEEVKGEEEMVDCGDESMCSDCVARLNKPIAARPAPPAENTDAR